MSVSLREVARRAGVSAAAVSQVINDHYGRIGVSEKRRSEILKIARVSGYRPNDDIAVIGPSLGSGAHFLDIRLLQAIQQAAQNQGLKIVTASLDESGISDVIRCWKVGAAVLLTAASDATVRLLEERGMPHVLVNTSVERDSDCVLVDDYAGMTSALDYLQAQDVSEMICAIPKVVHPCHEKRLRAVSDYAAIGGTTVTALEATRFETVLESVLSIAGNAESLGVVVLAEWYLAMKTMLQTIRGDRPTRLVSLKAPQSPWVRCTATLDLPLDAMGEAALEMIRTAWETGEIHQPSRTCAPVLSVDGK